ncbi:uncharacterized protein LOC129224833 [Uloborus diversus]|uniref:uncharacterized protein LOC129224833 n=1 Tax=Uloborus diversus TaxID=327109 RepID=UPI00240A5C2B|nr:uncharacterized protein LOC129224833 [Uloborus diversus]
MARIMFILLLSVLGCVLASPTCTIEEVNKCLSDNEDFKFMVLGETYPEDDEHLTKFCLKALPQLDCAIDFIERCPNSEISNYLEGLKDQKAALEKLCDTSLSFRAEYLEHAACMNNKVSAVKGKCADYMNMFANNFKCSTGVHNYQVCIEDSVEECGEKAAEIFRTLYEPKMDINTIFCEGVIKYLKEKGIIS